MVQFTHGGVNNLLVGIVYTVDTTPPPPCQVRSGVKDEIHHGFFVSYYSFRIMDIP